MQAVVKLTGNAGVHVLAGGTAVCVDAYHGLLQDVAVVPDAGLILVTHSHRDHFDPGLVATAALRTGAAVVGPASVTDRLAGRLAPDALVEMEPPVAREGELAASVRTHTAGVTVTAFRTFHTRDHNSYVVDMPGFRFMHDGDNEDTRRMDAAKIGRLDALFIGPWLGGGWVEFIEKLAPARAFLIHLDAEELRQHEAGTFLPGICDRVPPALTVLEPAQTFVFE